MTIILGFDPSKSTGWAIYDTKKHVSAIRCGVFVMPDKADHYYTGDQIALRTTELLREIKKEYGRFPDFAVLEAQSLNSMGNSIEAVVYQWVSVTAISATLANFGIPYGTWAPQSWRVAYFGKGFKPPFKIHQLKKPNAKGETERIEWLWKDAAVARCERDGIDLPKKKTIAHNAAEAVALAWCWNKNGIKLHAGRYQKPWMNLVQGLDARSERQVA